MRRRASTRRRTAPWTGPCRRGDGRGRSWPRRPRRATAREHHAHRQVGEPRALRVGATDAAVQGDADEEDAGADQPGPQRQGSGTREGDRRGADLAGHDRDRQTQQQRHGAGQHERHRRTVEHRVGEPEQPVGVQPVQSPRAAVRARPDARNEQAETDVEATDREVVARADEQLDLARGRPLVSRELATSAVGGLVSVSAMSWCLRPCRGALVCAPARGAARTGGRTLPRSSSNEENPQVTNPAATGRRQPSPRTAG